MTFVKIYINYNILLVGSVKFSSIYHIPIIIICMKFGQLSLNSMTDIIPDIIPNYFSYDQC